MPASLPLQEAPTEFVRNTGAYLWRRGQQPDITKPPDRFAPIPGYRNYRGGALYSFNQMRILRDDYGVRTIVNLAREANDHVYDEARGCGGRNNQCEGLWAQELGLTYLYIPLTGSWQMSTEKWDLIRNALADGNTYIHCQAGVDRTGAVVARWRRETEPHLTHEEVMRYTRIFGGAWRTEGDPNKKLREWIARGEYDPELAARAFRRRSSHWHTIGIVSLWAAGAGLLWWSWSPKEQR